MSTALACPYHTPYSSCSTSPYLHSRTHLARAGWPPLRSGKPSEDGEPTIISGVNPIPSLGHLLDKDRRARLPPPPPQRNRQVKAVLGTTSMRAVPAPLPPPLRLSPASSPRTAMVHSSQPGLVRLLLPCGGGGDVSPTLKHGEDLCGCGGHLFGMQSTQFGNAGLSYVG